MSLRIKVTGIKKPYCFMTMFHKDTVLNANTLKHVLAAEHLQTLFPGDENIHFDFSESGKINVHPKHSDVDINGETIQAGKKHGLNLGDVKLLKLGSADIRLEVFRSHFPAEIIRKKRGSYGSDD